MAADPPPDIDCENHRKDEHLPEQFALGRKVDVAQAADAEIVVVVAAEVVAHGEAGAVRIAAQQVNAEPLAVREEGDVAIADVDDAAGRHLIIVGALVFRRDRAGGAQGDAPLRQRLVAQLGQHLARRILPVRQRRRRLRRGGLQQRHGVQQQEGADEKDSAPTRQRSSIGRAGWIAGIVSD